MGKNRIAVVPVYLLIVIVVSLLSGCAIPGQTRITKATLPPSLASVAVKKGGIADDQPLPAGLTKCADATEFASAATMADGGDNFHDLPLPVGAVGARGADTSQTYRFAEMRICVDGSADATLRYFSTQMPGAGWKPTAFYPYGGSPATTCGDPYCWRKAVNGDARYVSLESLSSSGTVTALRVRLAVAPHPTASLAVRSNVGSTYSGYGTLTVSASCRDGEQMLGGGYLINSVDHTYRARASYPSGSASWTVTVHATGSTPFTLQTFVGCLAANYSLFTKVVTAKGDVPANQPLPLAMMCPDGSVAIGGGYDAGADDAIVSTSAPLSGLKGWNVVVGGGGAVAHASAYAMCATHSVKPGPDTVVVSVTMHPNEDVPAGLACAKGSWLTMGGPSMDDLSGAGHGAFSLDAPTVDYSTWYVQGRNIDTSGAHSATFWAACVIPDPFL
ncbi:MAG TPA: hypothetical protein VF807_07045 [Ktedonobacterales bacterium]